MKEENEIWRLVNGYDFPYEVSSKGRFKYPERVFVDRIGRKRTMKERIVKAREPYRDYKLVGLIKDKKYLNICIHYLVARAFPEICGQHFEGSVTDHIIPVSKGGLDVPENLRVCTLKDNSNNESTVEAIREAIKGYKHTEEARHNMSESQKKKIIETTKDGLVYCYNSITDAAKKYGIGNSTITAYLKGERKDVKRQSKWVYA